MQATTVLPEVAIHRALSLRERGLALDEQRLVLEHAGVGITLIQQRRVVRCNQRFAEIYGHPDAASVVGMATHALYADDAAFHSLGAAAYPVMAQGQPYKVEILQRRRSGSLFWARLTGTLIDREDVQRGSVWIVDDIDAQRAAEAALQAARDEQALIFDNALAGIVFLRGRRVTRCNRAFEQLFGYGPGELDGRSSRDWYPSDAEWEAAGRSCYEPFRRGQAYTGEMALRHRDGHSMWCEVRSKAIDPRRPELGSIWITVDITARKAAEASLKRTQAELEGMVRERTQALQRAVQALEQKVSEHQAAEARVQRLAHFDALTGLPNRVLLEDRARVALAAAQRHARPLALMFLDLDHFKSVNDALGHRVGDAVLVQLAALLKGAVRDEDTLCRLGGDEFVMLLPETDADGAVQVAEKLLVLTQQAIVVEGHELTISPSIGIALHPQDGADLDALSRAADAAMYRAKEDGRNGYRLYSSELQARADRDLQLGNALRRALERGQMSLVYQPQLDFASGVIYGVETLLRWQHPELGAVSPAEFIPIAESSGLLLPIGEWVLEQATRQLAAWDREGLAPLRVAVNVSSVQLHRGDLPGLVRRAVERAGIESHRLEIELTEGAAMKNPHAAAEVMNALAAQGVGLAIDDFGTGYSSLSYLKRFPVGTLKVDRSFVADLAVDADDRAIVDAIVKMAASLGMRTVAEGVETEAQRMFLEQRGCTAMQGYLLSRPLEPAALAAFVRGHAAHAAALGR